MSNVIMFDQHQTLKGDSTVEDLVHHLVDGEKITRGALFGVSDDGKINVTLAGEFMHAELLLMAEIVRERAMQGVHILD